MGSSISNIQNSMKRFCDVFGKIEACKPLLDVISFSAVRLANEGGPESIGMGIFIMTELINGVLDDCYEELRGLERQAKETEHDGGASGAIKGHIGRRVKGDVGHGQAVEAL